MMKFYYKEAYNKIQVPIQWTKYLLCTHPLEFITTIGRVNGKIVPNVAPFATCLDTSYEPPYITFSAALNQHAIQGQAQTNGKMNTYLNIRQNGLFVVNVPDRSLLLVLDIVAHPYERRRLEDKIEKAKLTKLQPFIFPERHKIYPPLINECLAHLECEVIDIHRPKGGDHYNITGRVVGASYDKSLGRDIDEIRQNLVERVWHHYGASSHDPLTRFIAYPVNRAIKTITFKLEERVENS